DPAAELPAVAVCLDARVTVRGPDGSRTLTSEQLYRSYFTTTLASTEILTEIWFPAPPARTGHAWLEFARRHGDYALVGVAAAVTLRDESIAEARPALTGGGGRPTRARAAAPPPLRLPPPPPRPDRHARRLRARGLRGLHGAARRRRGAVVPVARGADRRCADHDGRGARRRRGAAPSPAGGVPRDARAPVWVLHAGLSPDCGGAASRHAPPRRPDDPPGPGRQSLPVHRLPEHRARGAAGGRADGPAVTTRAIGARIPRNEDPRLLRGHGCFVDDVYHADGLPGAVLRRRHALATLA